MQTKSHGLDPKEKESKNMFPKGGSERAYQANRSNRVVDRVVNLYCAILANVYLGVTFEATIQAMVSLGHFSSEKTKGELKVLYDLKMLELSRDSSSDQFGGTNAN